MVSKVKNQKLFYKHKSPHFSGGRDLTFIIEYKF